MNINETENEKKAENLLKDAAEKAARLTINTAEKAARLTIDAAEKAALLPIDAAEKAALLLKDTTEKNSLLPAETKATLLLQNAAEKAALMPQDSVSKMIDLCSEATKGALLILKEEAENLAAKKIKFLDIAAHELRNPITSISLLLRVAEKQMEIGQPISTHVLARLRAPVDRLVRLIVDLLDMSKLERGLLTLIPSNTDIVSLISQCLEEFRIQAPKRNFLFNSTNESIEINIDPVRINQVLANFLDNAIRYTSEGPIEVALVDTTSAVRVSVTDHGAGIPKENLPTLFTTFSRGNFDTTVHTSGLGLGLSICKGIIDLHNGTLGVESEMEKGSTFYFELPKTNIKI